MATLLTVYRALRRLGAERRRGAWRAQRERLMRSLVESDMRRKGLN